MYEQIKNLEEMPNTIYQWDCGFWYDLDVSEKSDSEKENLLATNVLYKKVENG